MPLLSETRLTCRPPECPSRFGDMLHGYSHFLKEILDFRNRRRDLSHGLGLIVKDLIESHEDERIHERFNPLFRIQHSLPQESKGNVVRGDSRQPKNTSRVHSLFEVPIIHRRITHPSRKLVNRTLVPANLIADGLDDRHGRFEIGVRDFKGCPPCLTHHAFGPLREDVTQCGASGRRTQAAAWRSCPQTRHAPAHATPLFEERARPPVVLRPMPAQDRMVRDHRPFLTGGGGSSSDLSRQRFLNGLGLAGDDGQQTGATNQRQLYDNPRLAEARRANLIMGASATTRNPYGSAVSPSGSGRWRARRRDPPRWAHTMSGMAPHRVARRPSTSRRAFRRDGAGRVPSAPAGTPP